MPYVLSIFWKLKEYKAQRLRDFELVIDWFFGP